jgi:tetraacyldisaccharide 4'-kinase
MLEQHGLEIERHPFPDHHEFTRADLHFDESGPVVMTEKDAVKCRRFGGGDRYALPVTAAFDAEATRLVQQSIARLKP